MEKLKLTGQPSVLPKVIFKAVVWLQIAYLSSLVFAYFYFFLFKIETRTPLNPDQALPQNSTHNPVLLDSLSDKKMSSAA